MQEFLALEYKILYGDAPGMRKEPLYKRIRRLREARGLSVYRLAKDMRVSIQSAQQWEMPKEEGGTSPRRGKMADLARILNVDIAELEFGIGKNTDLSQGVSPDELEVVHIYRRLKTINKIAAETWKTEGIEKAEIAQWRQSGGSATLIGAFQDRSVQSGQLVSKPTAKQKKKA